MSKHDQPHFCFRTSRSAWLAAGAGSLLGGLVTFSFAVGQRARSIVPRDGELVDVEGGQLHYTDSGRGAPIVMVHGLGGQMRNFSYALSERLTARHRVILLDRPGSGYSRATRGRGSSLAEQAQMVADAIRKLGVVRPMLVGHSLGGAVALATALNNPGLVGGLGLIAPLTQPPELPPLLTGRIARSRLVHQIVARTVAVPLLMLRGNRRQQSRVFAPEVMPVDFEVRGGGLLLRSPGIIAAAMDDAAGLVAELPGLVERYASLNLPVDILFGRDDRILDPARNGSATALLIRSARLMEVDGGHMLPATQPDVVATWLMQAQRRIRSHHDETAS